VLVPNARDRDTVHRIIYEELCLGIIAPESRAEYQRVMADLAALGAQAIILGCTEISMLIGPKDIDLPTFDTTRLHARCAVEWALAVPSPASR
jgi:aspartate racemase